MPLVVVEVLPIDLERTSGSATSCERQLTLAHVHADHVGHVRVLRQKYQTGSRIGPKLDVQAVSAQCAQQRLAIDYRAVLLRIIFTETKS